MFCLGVIRSTAFWGVAVAAGSLVFASGADAIPRSVTNGLWGPRTPFPGSGYPGSRRLEPLPKPSESDPPLLRVYRPGYNQPRSSPIESEIQDPCDPQAEISGWDYYSDGRVVPFNVNCEALKKSQKNE